MGKHVHVLYIEDDDADARLLERAVNSASRIQIDRVPLLAAGLARLTAAERRYDAVLVDLGLPDVVDRLEAVRRLHELGIGIPIIVLTGQDDEETAIAALLQGAQDYIVKERIYEDALFRSVQYAMVRVSHETSTGQLREAMQELDAARDIQQAQFPSTFPELPGYEIAGQCEPALTCGGDYFDFFPLANQHQAIVIGDVSGHGLGPAMITASVRSVLRTLALQHSCVADILNPANTVVRNDDWRGRFMTMTIASLDASTGDLNIATAGHNALVLNEAGQLSACIDAAEMPMGMVDEFSVTLQQHRLQPGESLMLYTDGISETHDHNQKLFGLDRMLKATQRRYHETVSEIVVETFSAARSFAGGVPQHDDMTAVLLKRNPQSNGDR